MLDGEILRDELARLEERRRERLRAAGERFAAFMARHPEVERARRALRAAYIAAARQAAGGAPAPQPPLEAEKAYEDALSEALLEEGLAPGRWSRYFGCSSAGIRGSPGVRKNALSLRHAAVLSRMSLSACLRPECTFEKCDLSVFPEAVSDGPMAFSQRQQMARLYGYCRQWVDEFPNNPKPHLLLMGGVGLGKTYLLHAMAHRIIEEKRTAVLNTTAYHIVAEARHGFDALGNIEPYLSAPVLIIDDLGTEPAIPGVTAETLFTVLNERHSAGRHTLMATNLTLQELGKLYGETAAVSTGPEGDLCGGTKGPRYPGAGSGSNRKPRCGRGVRKGSPHPAWRRVFSAILAVNKHQGKG
jgi:DNA replication protein DnaC